MLQGQAVNPTYGAPSPREAVGSGLPGVMALGGPPGGEISGLPRHKTSLSFGLVLDSPQSPLT